MKNILVVLFVLGFLFSNQSASSYMMPNEDLSSSVYSGKGSSETFSGFFIIQRDGSIELIDSKNLDHIYNMRINGSPPNCEKNQVVQLNAPPHRIHFMGESYQASFLFESKKLTFSAKTKEEVTPYNISPKILDKENDYQGCYTKGKLMVVADSQEQIQKLLDEATDSNW